MVNKGRLSLWVHSLLFLRATTLLFRNLSPLNALSNLVRRSEVSSRDKVCLNVFHYGSTFKSNTQNSAFAPKRGFCHLCYVQWMTKHKKHELHGCPLLFLWQWLFKLDLIKWSRYFHSIDQINSCCTLNVRCYFDGWSDGWCGVLMLELLNWVLPYCIIRGN